MGYSERVAWSDLMDDMRAAGTSPAMQAAFARYTRRSGFDWFAYVAKTPGQVSAHATYPQGWQDLYIARNYFERDPILHDAKAAPTPFQWNRDTYSSTRGNKQFFGAASEFKVRSGITVPIVGVYGHFASLTLAATNNDNMHPAYVENISYLVLAALYYHKHTDHLLKQEREAGLKTQLLSDRERMCLMWTSRGKTLAETAELLGLHRATVKYHLNNAKLRLSAVSLPQAVAEAMRHGEIE